MEQESAVRRVARHFGGSYAALAEALGLARSTVAWWDKPIERRNGRGGAIPDRYHRPIIEAAAKMGKPIPPEWLVNV